MASNLAGWLADGEDLICLDEDGLNSPDVEGEDFDPELLQPGTTCPAQRGDTAPPNATWFLWPDKKTCILDILILKDIDSTLQSQYGIPSVHYQGALGPTSIMLITLPSIIAQEMANLPSRWLYEIDPTVATPMICKGWQDFYVFELMKLIDGTVIVPKHWYTKLSTPGSPSSSDFEYWGHVWRAHPVVSDHTHGYVVHMYETMEVWFMSPVWRIKGLDPHQETPVEILHVILLGFLKYFWHDAISRLNDAQKVELQVQLASFDITGLGIPPLAGQTLVQYAGSLTR
ncbi:hypothetical protein EDC04DRAFT_2917930 [Pisolithus marmoratus]|nr:hypothetical protein EDC04DRAFT_2917930 [Pisolithus marmoratus]